MADTWHLGKKQLDKFLVPSFSNIKSLIIALNILSSVLNFHNFVRSETLY